MKKIFILLFLIVISIALYFLHFYKSITPKLLPDFNSVKNNYKESDALLLDRNRAVIYRVRNNFEFRRLNWINIDDISPALLTSVIFCEDKRFYSHKGVDWLAFAGLLKNIFIRRAIRGASTITMQLVSILDERLKSNKNRRSITQKILQIKEARLLEQTWSKKEILEAYLNLISFRGELQGVYSVSQAFFNKDPQGLTRAESLLLTALIKNPNAPMTKIAERAYLLSVENNPQLQKELNDLCFSIYNKKLFIKLPEYTAPHLAHKLITKNDTEIVSTINAVIQKKTIDIIKQNIAVLKNKNVGDCACLIVDNKTGEVLAYVASSGEFSNNRFVDGIIAKRQAGSTLKPFLYALAFENKQLTPASILDDAPIKLQTSSGVYKPENYDKTFKGKVTVRSALGSSLNIPAVRAILITEVAQFVKKLNELGFSDLRRADFYGYSIALGSADVSLFELVNAYRTIANNGYHSKLKFTFEKDTTAVSPKKIYSAETAFLIADILSDREARNLTFGLENPLATKYWSAVKTGTSKDMRDNWCIGFSNDYTIGVWLGNFQGQPMWNVSGVCGSAFIWREIMDELHKNKISVPPAPPAGVIQKEIITDGNLKKNEWFIKNTEQPAFIFKNEIEMQAPKILYPVDGLIIAIDPDIPTENQKIFFKSNIKDNRYVWQMNGNNIENLDKFVLWPPTAGKYKLNIIDSNDTAVIYDSIEFNVRSY